MNAPLYSLEILRLAADGATVTRLDRSDGQAERRTPVCGSRMVAQVRLDAGGRVAAYGHHVTACALGQASAALLAKSVVGQDRDAIAVARDTLSAWLVDGAAPPPVWPGVDALARARAYPARHAAILLPFDTAIAAIDAART